MESLLISLLMLVYQSRYFWFLRDADSKNNTIDDVLIKLERCYNHLKETNEYVTPDISSDQIRIIFTKPPRYKGELDWREMKEAATELYSRMN